MSLQVSVDNQAKDLTSIFLRGSNQSDEPPLRLRAHFLPKFDQHQWFDLLGHAAGAAHFGPALLGKSTTRFGGDHLLLR